MRSMERFALYIHTNSKNEQIRLITIFITLCIYHFLYGKNVQNSFFLSILRHGHVINNVNIRLMLKILKKKPIILKITIVVAMLCSRPLEFIILIKLVIWPRSSLFLTMPTSSPCRDELRFQSLFLCSSCFIPHGHPLGSSIFQMSEFSALDTEECPTV